MSSEILLEGVLRAIFPILKFKFKSDSCTPCMTTVWRCIQMPSKCHRVFKKYTHFLGVMSVLVEKTMNGCIGNIQHLCTLWMLLNLSKRKGIDLCYSTDILFENVLHKYMHCIPETRPWMLCYSLWKQGVKNMQSHFSVSSFLRRVVACLRWALTSHRLIIGRP